MRLAQQHPSGFPHPPASVAQWCRRNALQCIPAVSLRLRPQSQLGVEPLLEPRRVRAQISEHGRVEVLKEALRQVGTGAATAEKLLEYIARHYDDTIEQLKQEGVESQKDVAELSALFIEARIVPCLDGIWRRPEESVDVSVA